MLLAPPVFNGLRALGEVTDALPKLTDAPFERVTTRVVMLLTALLLVPAVRLSGLVPLIRRGLAWTPAGRDNLINGFFAGLFSMAALFVFAWIIGGLEPSPRASDLGRVAARLVAFLLGAAFIGLFEEVFFRGFIHGALRTRLHVFTAVLLSSVFFSAIHFFRPLAPETIEVARWSSGFALLPHLFDRFVWPRDLLFAGTLFVMGLALSVAYEKQGNLLGIIGLHAGWVFSMQTGGLLFDRNREVYPVLLGHSDFLAKGALAIAVIALFLMHALLTPASSAPTRPPRRSTTNLSAPD
jgi:membrane protease YdiL (CAAX protease family)